MKLFMLLDISIFQGSEVCSMTPPPPFMRDAKTGPKTPCLPHLSTGCAINAAKERGQKNTCVANRKQKTKNFP
jgi:hypothetical protein